MKKLSERFMYYVGLLASHSLHSEVLVDDLEHIDHLIKAEEKGLLLKLPCKIGDFVYQVDMTNKVVRTQKVSKIEAVVCGKNEMSFRIWFETAGACHSFQFGKTVFFNKAEAIQVLDDLIQAVGRKSSG